MPSGRGRRALLAAFLSVGFALASATPAVAYWSSAGIGAASATTGTLAPPTAVTVATSSGTDVTVGWTSSAGPLEPTGYFVTRRSGATTSPACGTSPTALIASTSCVDTAVPAGTYTYAVTAVYRSWTATSAASGSVTVLIATRLAFTVQPANTVAGAPIAITVALQNAAGVTVPRAGVPITIAIGANPGSGVLAGTATVNTGSGGTATFTDLSINRAAAGYTLAATSPGLTSASSATFTISAGAATRIVYTSGAFSGVAANTANLGPLAVQVQDALGNPAVAPAGGRVITLSSTSAGPRRFSATAGGTSTSVTSVTMPAGSSSAVFYYGDERAGAPTITAASAGLASATQQQTIVAGIATRLAFVQQPTTTSRGAVITPSPTVAIQDQFGNRVTSTSTVTLAINKNGGGFLTPGNLNGTLSRAAVDGLATFPGLSITGGGGLGAGDYNLRATSGALTSIVSADFATP